MKTYFITGHKNSSVQILKSEAGDDLEDLTTISGDQCGDGSRKQFNNNVHDVTSPIEQNGTKSLPSLGRYIFDNIYFSNSFNIHWTKLYLFSPKYYDNLFKLCVFYTE